MPCYHPLEAWKAEAGGVFFGAEPVSGSWRPICLPCGQCVGCRLERSRQWAVRCMHESSLHVCSSFVTLTYSEAHYRPSLCYKDFQLFMRRLRRSVASGTEAQPNPTDAASAGRIRFFMAGEYGEVLRRPHFHALLFGKGFPDRVEWKRSPQGKLYRSSELEKLWPYGHSSVGDVTFESAAYVARYCMKKVTGPNAAIHYREFFDVNTGELCEVVPEFCRMSLKPGIGSNWIRLWHRDVYRGDGDAYCVVNGVKVKPPRFYDKYVEETCAYEEVRNKRELDGVATRGDNTPERLAVREQVTRARLSFKKRSVE